MVAGPAWPRADSKHFLCPHPGVSRCAAAGPIIRQGVSNCHNRRGAKPDNSRPSGAWGAAIFPGSVSGLAEWGRQANPRVALAACPPVRTARHFARVDKPPVPPAGLDAFGTFARKRCRTRRRKAAGLLLHAAGGKAKIGAKAVSGEDPMKLAERAEQLLAVDAGRAVERLVDYICRAREPRCAGGGGRRHRGRAAGERRQDECGVWSAECGVNGETANGKRKNVRHGARGSRGFIPTSSGFIHGL
jgi:hypothetical protein